MLIESFCFAGGRVHKYQIESPKGDQKHRPRIFSHCLDDRPHNILHIYVYQMQVMKFHFPHRWDQR